jgi:hypothetical protein
MTNVMIILILTIYLRKIPILTISINKKKVHLVIKKIVIMIEKEFVNKISDLTLPPSGRFKECEENRGYIISVPHTPYRYKTVKYVT